MVGAEIDHLITLALFKMTNIDFVVGFALLDRATIGTKLSKLRYFNGFQKDAATRAEFDRLDAILGPFLTLRNTLAHGVLIGRRGDTIIFMLTADYTDNLGSFSNGGVGYKEEDFALALDHGRECVKLVTEIFGVKPLHETTQYKLLSGKPQTLKAQRKSNPSKPRSPPRSSQA